MTIRRADALRFQISLARIMAAAAEDDWRARMAFRRIALIARLRLAAPWIALVGLLAALVVIGWSR